MREFDQFLQTAAGIQWRMEHPPIAGGSPNIPVAIPTGAAGQPAVQTLTSTATGGTFALVLDGQPTPAINPLTATGALVQAAVQYALGQYLGSGVQGASAAQLTVTGAAGGPWTVTVPQNFVNPLAANSPLTVDNSLATGGTVVAAVTQEGIVGGAELKGSGQVPTEAPHVLTATSSPAFAAGWSNVQGVSTALTVPTAAPARTDWEPLQFYEDADGYVHIEGVAAWGAAAAALIFTLPAGYTPFQSHDDNNVEILPSGQVNYMGATTSAGAINIGDISFRPVGI